jgi:hypothetical protein
MTEMGQEHTCWLAGPNGESNSVTGRNRCAAEEFKVVPIEDPRLPWSLREVAAAHPWDRIECPGQPPRPPRQA